MNYTAASCGVLDPNKIKPIYYKNKYFDFTTPPPPKKKKRPILSKERMGFCKSVPLLG